MTQINNTQQQPVQQAGRDSAEIKAPQQGAPEKFSSALKKTAPDGNRADKPGGAPDRKTQGKTQGPIDRQAEGALEQAGGRNRTPLEEKPNRPAPGDSPFTGGRDEREPGKKIMPDGDALLASLGGLHAQSRASAVQAPAAVQGLDATLTDKLVDRILVSAPAPGEPAEVRIAIKDDLLPGTEVRIQRTADGSLTVRFVTDNPAAERLLGKEQLATLQQNLGQTLQAEIKVQTVRPDGGLTAEADTGGGQQRDGGQEQSDQRRRSSQHDLFDGEPA